MRRGPCARVLLITIMIALLSLSVGGVHAAEPVVRAVLFYSPNCPHCHEVITKDLPPLFEKYGDRLQIIGVNTTDAGGSALFNAAVERFNVAPEDRGVPLLVIADVVLVGSLDIPQQLPALIEQHLAAGGVDWPEIPGLAEAIAQTEAAQRTDTPETATPEASAQGSPAAALTPTPAATPAPALAQPAATPTPGLLMTGSTSDDLGARFGRDPAGNGLAVVVLVGMLAALGWVVAQQPWRSWSRQTLMSTPAQARTRCRRADWAIPVLSLIGLGVAGYLAYVETQQVQAICGPVGDCNAVQQSAYARLFGLLPIGVVGVLGYLAILATWAVRHFDHGRLGQWAGLALWALTVTGVLFSIYLTFLEPFVIGATCAWCLTSAVIMTLLLLLVTHTER